MDQGVLRPSNRIACDRNIIGCHGPHRFDNLEEAIVHSRNPYFHEVMKRMIQDGSTGSIFSDAHQNLGMVRVRSTFGLGTDLGGHFPASCSGSVPDTTDYDRMWTQTLGYSAIYSISIGEGELLTTPMHMANLAATLANRYITPHAVCGSEGIERMESGIDDRHFDAVIRAMSTVVTADDGTGTERPHPAYRCAAKQEPSKTPMATTGIAFAPAENPQIALSIYVENAGAGGDCRAHRQLDDEKYLRHEVTQQAKEQRILEATYPFPELPL